MRTLHLDVAEIANRVAPRRKGLFYFRHYKPERHLKLIQGGQTAKQYAPRVSNQSNTTRLPAA